MCGSSRHQIKLVNQFFCGGCKIVHVYPHYTTVAHFKAAAANAVLERNEGVINMGNKTTIHFPVQG